MKTVYVDDVLKVMHEYGEFVFATDTKRYSDMVDNISNLPSAHKGITNGDILCQMFPNMRYTLTDKNRVVTTIGVASSFDYDWWNSPYELQ